MKIRWWQIETAIALSILIVAISLCEVRFERDMLLKSRHDYLVEKNSRMSAYTRGWRDCYGELMSKEISAIIRNTNTLHQDIEIVLPKSK